MLGMTDPLTPFQVLKYLDIPRPWFLLTHSPLRKEQSPVGPSGNWRGPLNFLLKLKPLYRIKKAKASTPQGVSLLSGGLQSTN